MSEFDFEAIHHRSDLLHLHFDVQDHVLSLDTFVRTAQQSELIFKAFDETFFDGKLNYELVVVPPLPGTFLLRLAVVMGVPGSVFAFANSTIGSAYIEGLTGQPSSHWAMQAGEESAAAFKAISEWIEDERKVPEPELDADDVCCAEAKIVVEMARGVLEREKSDIDRVGMSLGSLPDALDARNAFYDACLNDGSIRAVGFTPEDDFPIPRRSFPERAIRTERPKEEKQPPWTVTIENVVVTSPNWDQKDQTSRQWKGKDGNKRECFFVITDEEFWHHAKYHDLKVDVLDNLKVQWAFQFENGRIKNRRVIRVLEFNEQKLAKALDDSAIRAILGDYDEFYSPRNQGSLFD